MRRVKSKIVLIVLLFCNGVLRLYGQADTTKMLINNLDSLRIVEVESQNFRIMPYVAPSYTPETEVLFTAGGLITFKTQRLNSLLNSSSVPFSIGYSTNGAFSLNVQNVVYLTDDDIRGIGELIYKDMPDNYWGVGYQNGLANEKSSAITGYHRRYWRFYEKVMFRTKNDLFVGGVIDINGTKATKLNDWMTEDENIKANGTYINNNGIGVAVEYDTRDFVQNAYKGVFLSASLVFFEPYFGGNSDFKVLELDYRQYKMIKRERRTLAWNVKSRFAYGEEVPWSDMAMLGGMFNMRGYTLGRFRDRLALSATTEYRHMFQRRTLNKAGNYNSRFGYVAWVALGTVSPDLGHIEGLLPNAGLGLRFELQPRMNIRFDYGFGKDETGAYVTFSEAF